MSALSKIKEGIMTTDWLLVCDGYKDLTGESLECPEIPENNNSHILKKIRQLLDSCDTQAIAENTRDKTSQTDDNDYEKEDDETIVLDGSKITPTTAQEANKVSFITNNPKPQEIDRNRERASNKTRIRREPYKTFKVKCNECEEQFDSAIQSKSMGQKCPQCLSKKKRDKG